MEEENKLVGGFNECQASLSIKDFPTGNIEKFKLKETSLAVSSFDLEGNVCELYL